MDLFNFLKRKTLRDAPLEIIGKTSPVKLERQPDHIESLLLSADLAAKSSNSDLALQLYREVLARKPGEALAHYKCGNILKDREQLDAALACYDKAIAYDPGYAHAFCNRGVVLERLARWNEALESYDSAISLEPDDSLAHYNRAGVLRKLARNEDALFGYSQAIVVKPDHFEAYCNRGFLLIEIKRWPDAMASHAKCLEINPCFAPAHFGIGLVHQAKKEVDAALASFDRAIECDPGHASAHFRRGCLLMELRQWNAARLSLDRSIALNPEFAEAHYSLAVLWRAVGQYEMGLVNFDRAVALKPDYAEAYLGRGILLTEMRRFLPAIESFDRGVALNGDSSFVLGARCFAKMSVCDWSDYSSEITRIATGIKNGDKVLPPHQSLVLLDSPPLQLAAARLWTQHAQHPNVGLPAISSRRRRDKIRIGYFSGEFYQHPVPVLMAGVFESHDRQQHEVIAFSYGPHSQDDFGMRLVRGFDQFVDVREKSDRDVASLAREMEIDIAVDLAGLTGRGRAGIFAWRAAPVQVNYLGYAGTMGADFMDYLIADDTAIPEGHESYYSEKIVRLPHGFFPHDPGQAIAETVFSREVLSLPSKGFVFCCFNNTYKLTPGVFDSWMRILTRAPNSVLWLSRSNESAVDNLRRESLRRGVDPDRLIFASHVTSPPEHLSRQRTADLFLDTRPYNAHSTAIEALWVGLPVLTLPGAGFAGRVAASLLTAAQLPELIATSAENYEDLAVRFAENPEYIAAVKEKLNRKRAESPLFDSPRFVRYLESGYSEMLGRFHAGLPPGHIRVQA